MTITIAEIKQAMADLATIIETSPHGDKYWPWFERLERELVSRESRADRLKAAKMGALT